MIWSILILFFGLTFAQERVTLEYLTKLREAGRDEEYAKLLGIDDPSLVRSSMETPSEFLNKPVSPLGDIMLTKEQEEQSRQNINFRRYPRFKWKKNFIPYFIQENDFTKWQEEIIHQAIEEMNLRMTHFKIMKAFEFHTHEDSVVIINGTGCWSYLGSRGGIQALSLDTRGCVDKPTVMHEFMHAMGFTHEHNRYDRDSYVNILWDNIPKEWQSQFDKVDNRDFQHYHPYDYYSVMHYPARAGGIYEKGFEVVQDGVNEELIGRGATLSDIDVEKIDGVYQGCD